MCATVCKCHQEHFVLVLEQRKKKQFECCNATDSRSSGGILNHVETVVSLQFFFSLSASYLLHSGEKVSQSRLVIVLLTLWTLHLHPPLFSDKASLRISQIALHALWWLWLRWRQLFPQWPVGAVFVMKRGLAAHQCFSHH